MTSLKKFKPPKRGCSSILTIAFLFLFVAGEDVHLIDENGDRYLDLLSGIGVNALGYQHQGDSRSHRQAELAR